MHKSIKYIWLSILVLILILIRFYEDVLFYDPYLTFFKNDYLLLPDRFNSNFFWFYGNDTLHLQPAQTVGLVQNECGLVLEDEPFIGNDIGTLSSFKVDEVELKNKIAVSCVPGFFEVDAYLIYHDKSLQASHVIQSGEIVRGWMQLGNE